MGWWRIDDDETSDNILGDEPADILENVLVTYDQKKELRLKEVLDTLALLLRDLCNDAYWLDDSIQILDLQASIHEKDGSTRVITSVGVQQARETDLANVLSLVIEEVASCYLGTVCRLPRLSELLALFSFVLPAILSVHGEHDLQLAIVARTKQKLRLSIWQLFSACVMHALKRV